MSTGPDAPPRAGTPRWARFLPKPRKVRKHVLLRPFRRWLAHRSLWRLDQRSVALGVAIGLFFGILTPVAQVLFAAIAAVVLRANLAVAALSTLVTNPFTFPLIYLLAYRVGSLLWRNDGSPVDVELSQEAASHALQASGWVGTLHGWISSIGAPLAVGLVTLAVCASLAGYLTVMVVWRWRVRRSAGDRDRHVDR